jgi:hypothetical protein
VIHPPSPVPSFRLTPDFTKNPRLFPGVDIPVLSVDARQFPVTSHFRWSRHAFIAINLKSV